MSTDSKLIIIGPDARRLLDREMLDVGESVLALDPENHLHRLLAGERQAVMETMAVLSDVVELTDKLDEYVKAENSAVLN